MRVLLVEDDDDARSLMDIVLAERGHDVAAFADGESAWQALQSEWFPLLVLDWILPRMNGLDLCRRVRATRDGEWSQVVVITARHQAGDLVEVLGAGANDYLAKPFGLEALEVRLAIAERQVALAAERRQAEHAMEEAARLQGVLLASATVEHNLGNQLSLTMGYAELLFADERLPADLRGWAERCVGGVESAVQTLDKLRHIRRVERSSMRGGAPVLDLERSSAEAELAS